METPSTGYIALLLLCWSLQTVAVRDCSGLSPGYYADLSTSCRTYLLCRGKARSRGLHFNCPPGTKFHQATQVCHHESSVKCEEDQEIISIPPNSPRRLSEEPDNSVDATSKLDDSIRFKREKLTEQLHVSSKESEDVRKN